jgi:hypothetical protein
MTGTSGLKCLGSFARFGPVGSWEKTFLASLIGTEAWYSTKCFLRWKLKGIGAPRRLSFQLAVRTPPTEGIGSGLLPTVMAQGDREATLESTQARQAKYGGTRRAMYLGNVAALGLLPEPAKGLLPTPTPTNANEGEDPATWIKRKEEGSYAGMPLAIALNLNLLPTPRASENENRATQLSPSQRRGARGLSMAGLAGEGLLPTPMASDADGKEASPSQANSTYPDLSAAFYRTFNNGTSHQPDGKTFQLCHRYELEMMGFPVNWCDIPMELVADIMRPKSKPARAKKE